jgi:hypothetical protein
VAAEYLVWVTVGAPFTRGFHTIAEANYAHFIFGRSANVPYGNGHYEFEPSSVTDLTKVNVGLAWWF